MLASATPAAMLKNVLARSFGHAQRRPPLALAHVLAVCGVSCITKAVSTLARASRHILCGFRLHSRISHPSNPVPHVTAQLQQERKTRPARTTPRSQPCHSKTRTSASTCLPRGASIKRNCWATREPTSVSSRKGWDIGALGMAARRGGKRRGWRYIGVVLVCIYIICTPVYLS